MPKKTEISKLSVVLRRGGESLPVGELAESRGQIYFEYDESFRQRNLEISPFKLPLRQKFFQQISRSELFGLPGVFYDSLPDGWGLLVMDRVFRSKGLDPDSISPLSRLAYVGDRAIGALSYKPQSDLFEPGQSLALDLAELARESELILEGETEHVVKEVVVAGGSPGGARPKALIGLNVSTDAAVYGVYDIGPGYEHYVVKFRGFREPKSVGIVEYIYSIMARKSGINMPETRLLRSGQDQFFAIKRFDRQGNLRVHTHTLAGLLHSDFRKPEISYGHFLKVTQHLTHNHEEVLEAFRRMVFNILAYNRDDHAKNFSYIMDENGSWSLSPAYDVVYSAGAAGWHTMDISGEKHPQLQAVLALAKEHGIKKAAAVEVVDQVRMAVSAWNELAQEHAVDYETVQKVQTALDSISPHML
ncbi:MAG: type II toxin-antitoxin system HipA family toxin [Gammaproteobacteria bacterium]|nr:type II toxin-antitoxin system HipA family toxin [Gammaproteobacteria bacterium]